MRHLLIDFDSTIPNLALMKISAWAKARGDTVELRNHRDYGDIGDPGMIWISCIFTWHAAEAGSVVNMMRHTYPDAIVMHGGTGFDFGLPKGDPGWKKLPPEIENINPDYSIYDDWIAHRQRYRPFRGVATGFCQRGCNRKCQFCVVWRKEGRIDENGYRRLTEWVPDDRKKVILLDNDMSLAPREIHDQILGDAVDMGIKLSICQGYDIRTLAGADGPERAAMLAGNKPWSLSFHERRLYIAWDYPGIENLVRRGIENLLDAGFRGYQIRCYTITGGDRKKYGFATTFEQDYHRYDVLWNEYGVYPYVMRYNNIPPTDRITRKWKRYINRMVFKSCTWDEYIANTGKWDARLKTVQLEVENED